MATIAGSATCSTRGQGSRLSKAASRAMDGVVRLQAIAPSFRGSSSPDVEYLRYSSGVADPIPKPHPGKTQNAGNVRADAPGRTIVDQDWTWIDT
jgi:hypothetical protein